MRKSVTIEPKQRRSQKTRDRIFRVAAKEFAEKGLAGARIDEIASRARINKERIYAYFGSKEEMYREVLVACYAKAAGNRSLQTLTEADIPRMTGIIIDTFFEIHRRNPEFWRMLAWENLGGGKSLRGKDWESIRVAYISPLEALYRSGQAKGAFRLDVDFNTYVMLLFATTYFYYSNQITMSRLLNLKLRREEVRRQVEAQFLAIMNGGMSVSRPV